MSSEISSTLAYSNRRIPNLILSIMIQISIIGRRCESASIPLRLVEVSQELYLQKSEWKEEATMQTVIPSTPTFRSNCATWSHPNLYNLTLNEFLNRSSKLLNSKNWNKHSSKPQHNSSPTTAKPWIMLCRQHSKAHSHMNNSSIRTSSSSNRIKMRRKSTLHFQGQIWMERCMGWVA